MGYLLNFSLILGLIFILNHFNFNFNFEVLILIILVGIVKIPTFGFHIWLPKVHVEAPILASIILAGLILKRRMILVLYILNFNFLFIFMFNFITSVRF